MPTPLDNEGMIWLFQQLTRFCHGYHRWPQESTTKILYVSQGTKSIKLLTWACKFIGKMIMGCIICHDISKLICVLTLNESTVFFLRRPKRKPAAAKQFLTFSAKLKGFLWIIGIRRIAIGRANGTHCNICVSRTCHRRGRRCIRNLNCSASKELDIVIKLKPNPAWTLLSVGYLLQFCLDFIKNSWKVCSNNGSWVITCCMHFVGGKLRLAFCKVQPYHLWVGILWQWPKLGSEFRSRKRMRFHVQSKLQRFPKQWVLSGYFVHFVFVVARSTNLRSWVFFSQTAVQKSNIINKP